MEPRLKLGYFAFFTALIALPVTAFAHADPSDSGRRNFGITSYADP